MTERSRYDKLETHMKGHQMRDDAGVDDGLNRGVESVDRRQHS